jgi:hypothetical protein
MERAQFERLGAFVDALATAFDASRAQHLVGEARFAELRLELNELNRQTQRALAAKRGRERILTAPHSRLLHECLHVAYLATHAPDNLRVLMPDVFASATRDALYAMQLLDNYLLNQRIDALSSRYVRGT